MLANLNGWHALIIVGVIVLIFGAQKLPGLARSAGQSMKIFQSEIKSNRVPDDVASEAAKTPETPAVVHDDATR
jgi:sec-independent protein translocase protein TatA